MTAVAATSGQLRVHDLDVAAGERVLLRGVDFTLSSGEAMQLWGPSGSGKSTLLRTIATLVGEGQGLTLGGDTPQSMGYAAWRHRVSYSHPSLRFVDSSVEDVVGRHCRYGVSKTVFDPVAASADLSALGLGDALSRDPRELSSGELQRVALVRAFVHSPAVVLLDEPFAHLDDAAREASRRWLSTRQENGAAILIASHQDLSLPRLSLTDFSADADA